MEATDVYVIAEIGINHNGNVNTAMELVDEAFTAGANAVKFQAFDAKKLRRPELAMYELTMENFYDIEIRCHNRGIDFLCSAFDVEWLLKIDRVFSPSRIKVASSKIKDKEFLEECGKLKKPILLSTGMSTNDETLMAMRATKANAKDIHLMHCTSSYPTPTHEVNMRVSKSFGGSWGYSDHTLGNTAAIMAVARGAKFIEKHITLNPHQEGPDHHMSMQVDDFAEYVGVIREAEVMLGDGRKKVEEGAQKYLHLKDQYNLG